jgi:subtilisin
LIDPPPAWSAAFARDALQTVALGIPVDQITADWAWGNSTGRGVKVAVIDSGIDASHPAVGGSLGGYVAISEGPDGLLYDDAPHADAYGHGTACASIIRAAAPECEVYSVKVLGPTLGGRAAVFAAGLRWAVESGMHVCNLSLGTTRLEFFGMLQQIADLAYFRRVMLVTAANNSPVPSFPSMFASVISVASHDVASPELFYYNPQPPVDFGAHGIDVDVAWLEGTRITATGNSFAAPHITGLVARILAKHADLTPFEVKTILAALAANVRRPGGAAPTAPRGSRPSRR